MKLTVEVDMNKAAFSEDLEGELSRVLAKVAAKAAAPGTTEGTAMDINGNTVARFTLEP